MKVFSIIFSAFLCLTLCGCNPYNTKEYPKPVIVLPDDEAAETVNGYKTGPVYSEDDLSSSESSQSEARFIGNKNSKKYHSTDCRYAKNMIEESMVIFDNQTEAENAGYESCSVCRK